MSSLQLSRWDTAFASTLAICLGVLALVVFSPIIDRRADTRLERGNRRLQVPITVDVTSTYKFYPSHGVYYQRLNNIGLTYYAVGDGFTPGITTRSGRYVYDGAIAVSQGMWMKSVLPGDLIWVKATDRFYKVEDTMNAKYLDNRIDIFTHDMALAKSGSSRTDIIILRQPR